MTQNEHVYAICSRVEVVDDVISGVVIQLIPCENVCLNLWVPSFSSFRKIEIIIYV